MKSVLSTTDRASAEGVRLALESEGIATVLQNEAGSALPFIPVTLLVEDADYERARGILTELGQGAPPVRRRAPWFVKGWRVTFLVLFALAAIICGQILLP